MNFGEDHLLDILKFLVRATIPDSIVKNCKASEMERYFPYRWVATSNKLNEQQLLSFDDFYSQLKHSKTLDKEFDEYQKHFNSGVTVVKAMKKLELKSNRLQNRKTTIS